MSLSGHFLIKSLFVPNGLFIILIMQFIIDIENSDSNGLYYLFEMIYAAYEILFYAQNVQ